VEEYSAALEEVLIKKEDGMKYMPELYAVPADKVSSVVYSNNDSDCYGMLSTGWPKANYVYIVSETVVNMYDLTLWRPLLPYGYSYKASCARPG